MRWCFVGCLLVMLLEAAGANVTDESPQRTQLSEADMKVKQLQEQLAGVWRLKGTADEWHFDAQGHATYRWDDGQDFQDDRSDYRASYRNGHFDLDLFAKRNGNDVMMAGIARFQGQQLVWVVTDNWRELPEPQTKNVLVRPMTFSPRNSSEGICHVLEYEGKLPVPIR
jgi:hypothetical protein